MTEKRYDTIEWACAVAWCNHTLICTFDRAARPEENTATCQNCLTVYRRVADQTVEMVGRA